MIKPYQNLDVIQWCGYLTRSFNDLLDERIIEADLSLEQLAQALYIKTDIILSHRFGDVPRFCFANAAAQELFGYGWDEFIGIESSLSAQPESQEDRETLLKQARENGYIKNYSGVRIKKDRTLFEVRNVILWNVSDSRGDVVGQAALFNQWNPL